MFITDNFNEQIDGNPLSCEDDVHAVAEAADGNDEHDGSDAAVDVADGVDAETAANLVDEPCDECPPAECTRNDGSKAKHIEPPVLLTGIEQEVGACKERKEEKDDGRVADGEAEACEEILENTSDAKVMAIRNQRRCALGIVACHDLDRIAVPQIETIKSNEGTADNLKRHFKLLDPIDDKLERKDGDQGINQIAENCAETCEEPRKPPFIKGALDDEDACRPHRSRNQQAYH